MLEPRRTVSADRFDQLTGTEMKVKGHTGGELLILQINDFLEAEDDHIRRRIIQGGVAQESLERGNVVGPDK